MRWMCVLVLLAACSKPEPDKPIDVAAWKRDYAREVEAFRFELDAAAYMVAETPPTSQHIADPETPFVFEPTDKDHPANTQLISGVNVRKMPEFGRDKGKTVDSGDESISVNYFSASELNLESAISMIDDDKPGYFDKQSSAKYITRDFRNIRYLLLLHEISYKPGEIDTETKTFTPGTYEGIVYVVDMKPLGKHLGSVAFSAKNTGKFESYSGSEKFMLRADLEGEAMKAFRAEWPKVFPNNPLPPPPAGQ